MANRSRTNRNEFYLSDDEQYVLEQKFKLSGMKNKAAFLCTMILYGYVYNVDYSYLQKYNTELSRISSNLNQITTRINATGDMYEVNYYKDGYNLFLRLRKFKENKLLFLHDKRVPANNSLCERLPRVFKRKQKQAMVFRSQENCYSGSQEQDGCLPVRTL